MALTFPRTGSIPRRWRLRPIRIGALARHVARAARWIVPVAVGLVIAFGGGVLSARALLERSDPETAARAGWRALASDAGASVDPYTRARLSREGGLPLARAEGVAFVSGADAQGRALDASCRYRLTGTLPPARRWSLWVEPRVGDPARPSALHSQGTMRERDGRLVIEASSTVRPGNWLALPTGGPFLLRLALYDAPSARTDAGGRGLLAIRRVSCAGEATGDGAEANGIAEPNQLAEPNRLAEPNGIAAAGDQARTEGQAPAAGRNVAQGITTREITARRIGTHGFGTRELGTRGGGA